MSRPKIPILSGVTVLIIGGFFVIGYIVRPHVRFADVDGKKIAYARYGSGSPTVVFLGAMNQWIPWLPRIGTTAICYSQSGWGNSGPATDERTPVQVIDELHAMLKTIGIRPPFVLVGASLGGLYSRVYATRYSHEVAGLVLIDGADERQSLAFRRIDPKLPIGFDPPPGPRRAPLLALNPLYASGHLDVTGTLPDVPLAVLTSVHHGLSDEMERAWRQLQDDTFRSTTNGIHIVTNRSGHDIAVEQPAMVLARIFHEHGRKIVQSGGAERAECDRKWPSRPSREHEALYAR